MSTVVKEKMKKKGRGKKISASPTPSKTLIPNLSSFSQDITDDFLDHKIVILSDENQQKIDINKINPDLNEETQTNLLSQTLKLIVNDKENTHQETVLNNTNDSLDVSVCQSANVAVENSKPSAPVLEINALYSEKSDDAPNIAVSVDNKKIKCIPLQEAIRIYGGKEVAELKAMSLKEEIIVETDALHSSNNALTDLIFSFRSSLMAMEREQLKLEQQLIEEDRFRSTLWKVEKCNISISERCPCGARINFRATYDEAKLLVDRLPVAEIRLEAFLRELQDSFCYSQHTAQLAYCQIDDLISETIQGTKNYVREALDVVLRSLRISDGAPKIFTGCLERWASVLAQALLGDRDPRQLLFLLHHLFRQIHSVGWAARLISIPVGDSTEAACAIALLELMLARRPISKAVECVEDTGELWEEIDEYGSGAVSEGDLSERDLLSLMDSVPANDLIAKLALFPQRDLKLARECEWGDRAGGRGVLKATCGVRMLLATLEQAKRARPHYSQLARALCSLAAHALHAIAALHLQSRVTYCKELEKKIACELEACFAAGVTLFESTALSELPATLLSYDTAKDFCMVFIDKLHDDSTIYIESLGVQIRIPPCEDCVLIVTQIVVNRRDDYDLARIVLEFLLQAYVHRSKAQCGRPCGASAGDAMPSVLAAHPFLHTHAMHQLSYLNVVNQVEPLSLQHLALDTWRPSAADLRGVLEDWSTRSPHLIEHLLVQLDYTPCRGLSLDAQLTLGRWLCEWCRRGAAETAPEWAWHVLRQLRVHRTHWALPCEAPDPDTTSDDLFSIGYRVLASSWGHSIPLICEYGIDAVCCIARSRPRDAAHCLSPIMIVMAQSPESLALTPKFNECFTILLGCTPSLVQRALGRGGVSGYDVLQRLLLAHLTGPQANREALVSTWLCALWRPTSPGAALAALDTAMLATSHWKQIDAHAFTLLQEEVASEHVSQMMRNASSAPLLCERLLWAAYCDRELRTRLYGQLARVLRQQRTANKKIRVGSALSEIGSSVNWEDLIIYKMAAAALVVPATHPCHLRLWSLFFQIYLQKNSEGEESFAVGPLLFSGLIKSRTIGQIKKRLEETAAYHLNKAERLKTEQNNAKPLVLQTSSKQITESSYVSDLKLFPMLTIIDLSGQSSNSSSESDSGGEATLKKDELACTHEQKEFNKSDLLRYHTAAEGLLREYHACVSAGEQVRANPQLADVARVMPNSAFKAACDFEVARICSELSLKDDEFRAAHSPQSPAAAPPSTPFHAVVSRILSIKSHQRRSKRRRFANRTKPLPKEPEDARALLASVDEHLTQIEFLAREWSSEACKVSGLDRQLLQLVRRLRAPAPLPAITRRCPNNCPPVTLTLPNLEWCISTGVEREIKENRWRSRAAVARLARPRPLAARAAARLSALLRAAGAPLACTIADRVWRCAAAADVGACAPARLLLTSLVNEVAERWISRDGQTCVELIRRWSTGAGVACPLQQALCGSVVAPRHLRAADWPPVYSALLAVADRLPADVLFSYLSKFELAQWSESCEPGQRREMLETLLVAAQRSGPSPADDQQVVLELIGVHTAVLLNAHELCAHVCKCARLSVARCLSPSFWAHILRAVDSTAHRLTFDQVGNVLRELGDIWRGRQHQGAGGGSEYARAHAQLLHSLQRAFVSAAHSLAHAPDAIGWYAWSTLQESWCPWVTSLSGNPEMQLIEDMETYIYMLSQFIESIQQVIADCPGSEHVLLQHAFDWAVHTWAATGERAAGSRVSALLLQLATLPWTEHQWFHYKCLQNAMQACMSNDIEMKSWCAEVLRGTRAPTWTSAVPDAHLAPHLAALFALFTSLHLPDEALKETEDLPWGRLPLEVLGSLLERYFEEHHSGLQPYHSCAYFRVVLSASGLLCSARAAASGGAGGDWRDRRALAVSLWTRALCAPAYVGHVAVHVAYMLDKITDVVTQEHLDDDEMEDLLLRALTVLCIEPAAANALPVWERWLSQTGTRMRTTCVRASGFVTAFEYFAALADSALISHLSDPVSCGWSVARAGWARCPWLGGREASLLVARRRLHAAYGLLLARPPSFAVLRADLLALLAAEIDFVECEVITSVWVCVACRVSMEVVVTAAGAEGRADDAAGSAAALLARWGQEQRRSLLKVVTMQPNRTAPTGKVRLLCCLAQCILTPNSEAAVKAYECCCAAVLGAAGNDLVAWGRAPKPKALPMLAIRLFPNAQMYFREELDMAPETYPLK